MSDLQRLIDEETFPYELNPEWEVVTNIKVVEAARLVANLTEQTRTVMGQDDDGTPNGKDYIERRLVSDWAAALTPGDTR